MKILLTNDDGIYSKGIYALYEKLTEIAEVVVVAPITEQSAVGHAITISDPLRIYEVTRKNKFFGYGVKGTPADCVKLAFDDILTTKPDLVVSGINHGANLSSNVIYSGTISAATEGAMMGVKSFAISLASVEYSDFSVAAQFGKFFAKYLHELDVGENLLFNINVPPLKREEIKGWKFTVQGRTKYLDTFEKRVDPRGNTYYWLTGEKIEVESVDESDDKAINNGYISVTPLKYDMTNYNFFNKVKMEVQEWEE
ncbi:5'/3'-nucleotidase SurE [Deferribacter autotrophicus]|uniref:5'-nucleotidase SurE n=1 Tax=Deferribacter autotrophicus TaxID=500465 RepID=A0A5A8F737_9BACT|nr:5'/3'-nucleotidase SurE [Deferribacter autotrophicus]KAA0259393.1 5'/3'-nucleotidase SurE [Deferribacter autotrophicus]